MKHWLVIIEYAKLVQYRAILGEFMQKTHTVNVLLFNAFSNHCLANTIEPLRAANTLSRQAHYQWRFYTLDGEPVASSSGLVISPDGKIKDASGGLLIVMPSYDFKTYATWETARLLRAAAKRHRTLAGLDTGSWLLADAGLLHGYQATIHWEELIGFEEAFPDVSVLRERFVIDRDRITSSGAMTAFDLVLQLISDAHGPLLAMEVGQLFMSVGTVGSVRSIRTPSGRLSQKAISVMQENLEEPLSISQIARKIGCTQKSLEQKMMREMRATPQSVYRRLRLGLARKLVQESDLPIAEISGRCGYENPSAMTRAFRHEFEIAPSLLRQQLETQST